MSGRDLSFDPLAPRTRLSDDVARRILERITADDLGPGERLPSERELGEQFGVSRTVIREAVRALAAKGVIEVRSGSGLRVAAVGAGAVTESMSLFLRGIELPYAKVHEVRWLVELEIARLAASRASAAEVDALAANLEQMASSLDDVAAVADLDGEFHRLLAACTQNELYLVILDAMGDVLREVRRRTLAIPGRPSLALEAHRRILAAVRANDADLAVRAMTDHLRDSRERWEEALAASGDVPPEAAGAS